MKTRSYFPKTSLFNRLTLLVTSFTLLPAVGLWARPASAQASLSPTFSLTIPGVRLENALLQILTSSLVDTANEMINEANNTCRNGQGGVAVPQGCFSLAPADPRENPELTGEFDCEQTPPPSQFKGCFDSATVGRTPPGERDQLTTAGYRENAVARDDIMPPGAPISFAGPDEIRYGTLEIVNPTFSTTDAGAGAPLSGLVNLDNAITAGTEAGTTIHVDPASKLFVIGTLPSGDSVHMMLSGPADFVSQANVEAAFRSLADAINR